MFALHHLQDKTILWTSFWVMEKLLFKHLIKAILMETLLPEVNTIPWPCLKFPSSMEYFFLAREKMVIEITKCKNTSAVRLYYWQETLPWWPQNCVLETMKVTCTLGCINKAPEQSSRLSKKVPLALLPSESLMCGNKPSLGLPGARQTLKCCRKSTARPRGRGLRGVGAGRNWISVRLWNGCVWRCLKTHLKVRGWESCQVWSVPCVEQG